MEAPRCFSQIQKPCVILDDKPREDHSGLIKLALYLHVDFLDTSTSQETPLFLLLHFLFACVLPSEAIEFNLRPRLDLSCFLVRITFYVVLQSFFFLVRES